jgi:hypothetical protein
VERNITNRWTGATGSDFRIKLDPAKLSGSAVARSTQPFDGYNAQNARFMKGESLMRTRRVILITVIGFVFLFLMVFSSAASLQSIPPTLVARTWLAKKGKDSGLFTLTSFRRTNGVSHGDGVYTIEFQAVVACTGSNVGNGPFAIALTDCDSPACTKGKTVKYSGKMTLEKTERGWRFHHCGES